ncbi:MAG TPA: hypothetical protein VHO06_21715 [Polyangia bacterium]|nr:hypothetical protein [Polyangia bacterium]
MDETPEELEQIRREAEQIDVNHYKKRFRALRAIALGALAAGAVELAFVMVDSRRNPCERVRNHFCKQDPAGLQCKTYAEILDESLHDSNPRMRANIKAQCQSKIDRMKDEDGIEVK